MADQPDTPSTANPRACWTAWLKPIFGALAGLFSGAVMMYLSPLLDKVFRPAKPVANFAADAEGMSVTFHNRSQGVHNGWWDFGDGSPLELIQAKEDIVNHTYTNPGDYSAKLVVRNCLGDSDERAVTLHLDERESAPPLIEKLEAIPISPGSIAPATFKVTSKVTNAQVCVWSLDDDRPLELVSHCTGGLERLVTFQKPGGYVIKLAAVNGNNAVEKSEIVNVMERPPGMVSAVLTVTDQATQVETVSTPFSFVEQFPSHLSQDVHDFEKQAPARQGFEITDVRLLNGITPGASLMGKDELAVEAPFLTGMGMRNVKLKLASDHRSVRLSGQLARDPMHGKKKEQQPNVTVPVLIVQEKRSHAHRPPVTITASFSVPGSTLLALPDLPKDWVDAKRQVRLDLMDGDRIVIQESYLPRNRSIAVQNKHCVLNAEQLGDHIRIDLNEDKGTPPVAN
jgi:PKD repeat protein